MDDRTNQPLGNTTEEANRFTRNLTEQSERAAQANAKLITDQAEAFRRMWQASAEMAANLTKRSADEVARTFGIGGGEAEKAAGQASDNVGALVHSASVVANAARAISTEWVDLVRHGTERSVDQMNALMRCRSPSDLVTMQTHALRDNMEALLDCSRRIAEIALQTTAEASREIGQNVNPMKPAE